MLFDKGELILSRCIVESNNLIAWHFGLIGLCQLHTKHLCNFVFCNLCTILYAADKADKALQG